jgi:hypothetical protein
MYHIIFLPEDSRVIRTYHVPDLYTTVSLTIRTHETVRVDFDTIYNTPVTLDLAVVTPDSSL